MKYKGKKLRTNEIFYKNPVLVPLSPGNHGLAFKRNGEVLVIRHIKEGSTYDCYLPNIKDQRQILGLFEAGDLLGNKFLMDYYASVNLLGHNTPDDYWKFKDVFPAVATKYLSGESFEYIKSLGLPRAEELVRTTFSMVQKYYSDEIKEQQKATWLQGDKDYTHLQAEHKALSDIYMPQLTHLAEQMERRKKTLLQQKADETLTQVMDEVKAKLKQ